MSVSEQLTSQELDALVGDVNQYLRNKRANRIVGSARSGKPRFELYHGSLSLCSHKVRTVLAEKGQTYISHALNIMPAGKAVPQNYRPPYVRLRLKAAGQSGYATSYSGASAVRVEGVDPCVVPTLIDHEDRRVVIDSRQICEYIAENVASGTDLIPDDLSHAIALQTDLVDQAPHVALLYGSFPDDDPRPKELASAMKGVHEKKIAALRTVLDHIGPNSDLRPAFESKITKELAAGAFVIEPEKMRDAHARGRAHVAALQQQLKLSEGPWIFGDRYTMADLLWTISLYRLTWLGFAKWWGADTDNDRVPDYYARAVRRPAFRSAVADWKYAHGPSPHVEELSHPSVKPKFLFNTLREMDVKELLLGTDLGTR